MKITIWPAGILAIIFFISTSCKQNAPHEDAAEPAFVAHPVAVPKQDVMTLEIGKAAPDFRLPDVNGKFVSLSDFDEAKVLVIIFHCNHCPTAQAYEDRMIDFTNEYKEKGVDLVAIMPNSAMGLLPEECGYTDLNDSFEEMKIRYEYKKYNFPYLYDGDNQSIAIAYGPVATPHAFVFDKERKLQYSGRIDGVEKPGGANAEDLRAAVDALLAGKPVETPVNKVFGCTTKWAWKSEYGKKVEEKWNAQPSTISRLDEDGIMALVKNPTEKLRLINIWATWCAPCVMEYPELVALQRWYGHRNFEFVSLSADNPEHQDRALAFLEKTHSPVQNFIYAGTDKYKLIEAVDPKWDGALPYTLLVEPGGKVVYSSQGPVDLLELKRAIVEHPLMGRYY
ncbi:MAG: redoxin domain-containing protein [Cyclobacteriaceae bacterium]|nr:redoxin domain-containing protein [Cyclobacteriaceae bacterium]MDH4296700.1 redoxin domain-containing protein [Cyclobacteriaceae bacterium]MDH5251229.1 redoxin domain-containing protein [Cyclobacteriaceae bacterium]